jgi:hypothetical protein
VDLTKAFDDSFMYPEPAEDILLERLLPYYPELKEALPWELDAGFYDNRFDIYTRRHDDLVYLLSPDLEYLNFLIKYQALWLTSRLDLVDYLYNKFYWFSYREEVYWIYDTWRAFCSICFKKGWTGFPFWHFGRYSFLPRFRKK